MIDPPLCIVCGSYNNCGNSHAQLTAFDQAFLLTFRFSHASCSFLSAFAAALTDRPPIGGLAAMILDSRRRYNSVGVVAPEMTANYASERFLQVVSAGIRHTTFPSWLRSAAFVHRDCAPGDSLPSGSMIP